MRLLRMHNAILKRHTDSTSGRWNEKGDWEEVDKREETPFQCCIQPTFSGSEYQKVLPSGIHRKDCKEIYTKTKLQTGDEYTQANADYIEFEGVEYEVYENNPWDTLTGRLAHHRAIMIRRDKLPKKDYPRASIGGY